MKNTKFSIRNAADAPKPYHYTACGLDNIFLTNGYTLEKRDGKEYASIKNIDGLWKAIGLKLCLESKNLSPKEFRFLRRLLSKTQAELATDLRVSDQTVARWEKGETDPDGPADFSIRMHFLLSRQAQPEGGKHAERMLDVIKELIEQDELKAPRITLTQRKDGWVTQKQREAA